MDRKPRKKRKKAPSRRTQRESMRPKCHNTQGLKKSGKGRYEASIADFNRAIQLKQDYAEAYYNRGSSLAQDECVHT